MRDQPALTITTREHLVGLITASAGQDHTAFAALYEATRAKMSALRWPCCGGATWPRTRCRRSMCGSERHADRFDPARASPITWMATIVRNLAIDMLRSSTAQPTGDESELLMLPAPMASALQGLELSEERQRAVALLNALDPVKRRRVVAAYLHGESRQQLARRFGVPVNTVKTWLRRAILEMQVKRDGMAGERVA